MITGSDVTVNREEFKNYSRLTCKLKFDWNSSLSSAGTEESHAFPFLRAKPCDSFVNQGSHYTLSEIPYV